MQVLNKTILRALGASLLTAAAFNSALAHTGVAPHGHGFAAGFTHPLFGLDHLAAMVAVGLWSSTLGGRAVWAVPAAFVTLLVGGAVLSASGVGLPGVETLITASVVVLGLLTALKVRLPMAPAALLVGLFGIFHGHAHGAEMPALANPLAYGAGFALATSGLHIAGIGLGLGLGKTGANWLPRAAGALIAGFGLALPFMG